eukprot:CAMPEP_0117651976 /NCGR_PEP_ID=MMETSP0804-20121206/2381_1 /TAXON_ID=1074897 /ORGANISM="Tetraselmis astigmatica, Strain CCMP880" /LENGTH=49 /DNA_ID=CAMNT_0005457993 /DNA_START=896 /DNA_END=1045 /DNA_ORIENTATION=+
MYKRFLRHAEEAQQPPPTGSGKVVPPGAVTGGVKTFAVKSQRKQRRGRK